MNYTLDKIEELRRERNIKVNHLCKATGVSQSTYTTWIAKDRTPQSKHLKPIAEYFNKPISYFYDEEKKEKPTDDDGLSENIKALMDFVKTVPEDKAELVLKLMRTIVEDE